jgi:hypothetical protein
MNDIRTPLILSFTSAPNLLLTNLPVMETHKRILGILYIVSGAFQILGMILISSFMGLLLPFIFEQAQVEQQWVLEWLVPFIRMIAIGIVLIFSVPAIIGGIGLLNQKRWSMILVLVLGCFKLFSFPVGTALGIYTIWVYAEDQKLNKAN